MTDGSQIVTDRSSVPTNAACSSIVAFAFESVVWFNLRAFWRYSCNSSSSSFVAILHSIRVECLSHYAYSDKWFYLCIGIVILLEVFSRRCGSHIEGRWISIFRPWYIFYRCSYSVLTQFFISDSGNVSFPLRFWLSSSYFKYSDTHTTFL